MATKDIQFVNDIIYAMFLPIACDSIDCGEIADALTEDVVNYMKAEIADESKWDCEDVRMAVVNTLKEKLNIN